MKDICVIQDDSLDNFALLGEILGAAGVNIEGLAVATCNGQRVIHFVVEDAITAEHVLTDAGIRIEAVSEVFILHKDEKRVTGKPGSFGNICRLFAENKIRIKFGYPAENNRFVFGVDDVQKAKDLLA